MIFGADKSAMVSSMLLFILFLTLLFLMLFQNMCSPVEL